MADDCNGGKFQLNAMHQDDDDVAINGRDCEKNSHTQ